MEIVLDLFQTPTGRLIGIARARDSNDEMAFSGAMELLACIERLRDRAAPLEPTDPAA
jgi:hypothetical protein